MRIASFNLESLDDAPGAQPSLAERIAALRPQLLRLDADVLCLQEVNGQKRKGQATRELAALEALLAGTPYGAFHRAQSHHIDGPGPAEKHNLVILSRWEIEAQRQVHHDLVAPPRYRPATAVPPAEAAAALRWDRPLLHATLRLPGGERLQVINLHLRAPLAAPVAGQKLGALAWKSTGGWAEGFFLASLKRSGQALEARLLVESLFDAAAEALIVVCGDFNAEVEEVPLRILRGDPEGSGNPELAARRLLPLEQGLPEARRYSVLHKGRRLMLDHLLASPALAARHVRLEIHNEALADEYFAALEGRPNPGSFHAPLLACFQEAVSPGGS